MSPCAVLLSLMRREGAGEGGGGPLRQVVMVVLAARSGLGGICVRSAGGSAIGRGPSWRSLLVVLGTGDLERRGAE